MSQTSNPYIPGGKNKIIWGGDVSEGTSGGNTSYNPETGTVQYISGYANEAQPAAVNGLKAAAPGGTSKKSGGGAKAPTPKATAPKVAPKPQAPMPVAPSATMGTPIAPGGGGGMGAGGGGAAGGEGGILGMLAGMGGGVQPQVPFEPQLGPGLRPGLGQRAYPQRNTALAALQRIY